MPAPRAEEGAAMAEIYEHADAIREAVVRYR